MDIPRDIAGSPGAREGQRRHRLVRKPHMIERLRASADRSDTSVQSLLRKEDK
jgi:hypothetical protein